MSMPPCPGRHRISLTTTAANPRHKPRCRSASSAYLEQLGSQTQRWPTDAGRIARYQRRDMTLKRSHIGPRGQVKLSTSRSRRVLPSSARVTDGAISSGTRRTKTAVSPVTGCGTGVRTRTTSDRTMVTAGSPCHCMTGMAGVDLRHRPTGRFRRILCTCKFPCPASRLLSTCLSSSGQLNHLLRTRHGVRRKVARERS